MTQFSRMRARLVDAGLLDAELRITPAGERYTEQLIDDLRNAGPKGVTGRATAIWNTGQRSFKR